MSSTAPESTQSAPLRLFLDIDGVLADFDTAAARLFGEPPGLHAGRALQARVGAARFWRTLQRVPGGFFTQLALLPDALTLFRAVEPLKPTLLTGCPLGGWAEPQKRLWAAEHFPSTPIITCMARDKVRHARVTPESPAILVDDTLTHRHLWERAGGTFIHHVSAQETLARLEKLGVLPIVTAV